MPPPLRAPMIPRNIGRVQGTSFRECPRASQNDLASRMRPTPVLCSFWQIKKVHLKTNVGQLGTRQLGTRTTGHQTTGHRTTGHQDNWAPGQLGTGQLGTRTTGHQDNWAPDNWAPGQLGIRTTGHQDNLVVAQLSGAQFFWCPVVLVRNCPVPSCP